MIYNPVEEGNLLAETNVRDEITSSEAELVRLYSYPDEEVKSSFIANMEKVEVVLASDPSIEAIVHEELSSVYAGEKDISEAAKTLEDRLKTLYSEKD
ncbi:MAG: hypothetical protein K6G47_08825 [Clostridia bacterium]|nr:hypothetical protein [Clostridia bacterium]